MGEDDCCEKTTRPPINRITIKKVNNGYIISGFG